MAARTDDTVLDYLRRRWRRRLDATTIPQAQRALALPESTAQRIRLYRALVAQPALWRRLKPYGQTPLALTLTEDEKLAARALRDGASLDAAFARTGMDEAGARAARSVLRAVGLLAGDRPVADTDRFDDGVGLHFHTVRVEGEPAFAVH